MSKKSNGGLIGKKSTDNIGIRGLYTKPRDNGGFVGIKRLSSNPDLNIGKTSGFWNASNFKVQPEGANTFVDTPYSYQENYWVYPEPYQEYVITSQYAVASGWWDPNNCGYGGGWGGEPWAYASWEWTCVGCCPWEWTAYETSGYYQWVYPQPYIDTRTVSGTTRTYTYYPVWDYF
jgi:hypothetical protein